MTIGQPITVAVLVMVLIQGPGTAIAEEVARNTESEREVLARVVQEIQALEALVLKAKQRKPIGTRVSFDYDQLLLELKEVSRGIEEYIGGTRLQPRTFAPLRADYTRVKSRATEGKTP